ncbi:MAG TPA: hypothetical protein VG455_02130 [Acidimicrobiales bacterium]|nr:hypothetical protein [Acidimicrobiales bacterium]
MTTLLLPPETDPPVERRDDRLLAPTRWTARLIVPILVAAFVILFLFPGSTMRLWSWMVCPEMSAMIMGAGYVSGAWFFTRVAAAREWHRVAVGFLATIVFASLLMLTTILHWDGFNHDHVSFWAWLGLYASTPPLLPVLWWRNRRTDPGPGPADVRVPRGIRVAVGVGGALQLAVALVMFLSPATFEESWPWELQADTARSLSAFIAFPAVTWLCFLFEDRWSSFRVTQQTATLGLALIGVAALRARGEFRDGWESPAYAVALVVALVLNVALYLAMERRASAHLRRAATV